MHVLSKLRNVMKGVPPSARWSRLQHFVEERIVMLEKVARSEEYKVEYFRRLILLY